MPNRCSAATKGHGASRQQPGGRTLESGAGRLQNKVVRAGRTPAIIIKLLNALREAGLEKYLRVVGTHALYAYESFAGVRIASSASDSKNDDLFYDAGRGVALVVDVLHEATPVIAALRRADPSFHFRRDLLKRGPLPMESVINDKGFEVKFPRHWCTVASVRHLFSRQSCEHLEPRRPSKAPKQAPTMHHHIYNQRLISSSPRYT